MGLSSIVLHEDLLVVYVASRLLVYQKDDSGNFRYVNETDFRGSRVAMNECQLITAFSGNSENPKPTVSFSRRMAPDFDWQVTTILADPLNEPLLLPRLLPSMEILQWWHSVKTMGLLILMCTLWKNRDRTMNQRPRHLLLILLPLAVGGPIQNVLLRAKSE